mmetsp:Transcript_40820/g.39412  ORF Transcript_40820/g.39412 Transcript_40820/m.39412 type:complete len:83 (-) Transcript_40820:3-251(-)
MTALPLISLMIVLFSQESFANIYHEEMLLRKFNGDNCFDYNHKNAKRDIYVDSLIQDNIYDQNITFNFKPGYGCYLEAEDNV